MTIYQIIHVKSDRSEQLIAEVDKPSLIRQYTETDDYKGAWISDSRKLLRFKRGEIVIRIKEQVPVEPEAEQDVWVRELEVVDQEVVSWSKLETLKLKVVGGGNLQWLMLTPAQVIAYDGSNNPLWTCDSFTELGEMLSKRFAYRAHELHETYTKTYGYQSAI